MSSASSILPLLRAAAPRLSRRFFPTQSCRSSQLHNLASSRLQLRSSRDSPFLKAFRQQSTAATNGGVSSIANAASKVASKNKPTSFSSSFPKVSDKIVSYWLFGSAASVFGIVIFGGLTRLTESGLSITEWRPVTGSLPPMSAADWDSEFTKYKASPEFKQLNSNMDLAAFKQIYWMEWTHRLWGRVIGLTTLIPTIYFIARKRVSFPMARNLVLINLGIVSQGVVGWWMVASGLKDDLFAKGAHPRVSQYRLATHLALAFTVYSAMLWNGLQILRERHLVLSTQPGRATAFLERLNNPALKPFRIATAALTALVCVTVVSGALVAGLDAGLIYNEFPWMGNGLTPPKSELFDSFYSRQPPPHSDLWWRNFLENPSLVQLDHRILATTTFVAINALFAYARFSPHVRAIIPRGTKMAMTGVLGMAYIQVTLGLTTLLYLVPTTLAAAHQAGALALLSTMVLLGSRVWTRPRLRNLVRREYLLMKGRHGQFAKKMGERKAMASKVEGKVV